MSHVDEATVWYVSDGSHLAERRLCEQARLVKTVKGHVPVKRDMAETVGFHLGD